MIKILHAADLHLDSAFAALTGYHSAIEETGRQIETRFEKPPHEPEEDEWQPE